MWHDFWHWYFTTVAPTAGSHRDSFGWGLLHALLAPVDFAYHLFNGNVGLATTSKFSYMLGFWPGAFAWGRYLGPRATLVYRRVRRRAS